MVLELLADPDGAEWRHKVGVAGPSEGSAKPTTRLFAARGWVCKTRLDHAFATADEARAMVLGLRDRGLPAGVWHPDKVWAVMRVEDAWYPLTLCRELVTLRQLTSFEARTRAWTQMLQQALDVHHTVGLGLDLNPANFATAAADPRLYYLDEELYDTLDARDVAGAIVARIPEEADATAADWRRWGLVLRASLALGHLSWSSIRDELARYPLLERYHPLRAALGEALVDPTSRRRPARGDVTCVIADVHANVAALEAVIEDALAHGAQRFLFLGDAVGYGPDPAACVRRLAELPGLEAIRGNHDHAIATNHFELGMNSLARACAEWTRAQLGAAELAWLAALPTEHIEERWIAVHGAPRDPHRFLAYVYELTYEDNLRDLRHRRIPLCFYGHTHVQLTHVELPAGPSKLPGVRELELDPRHYWLVNPGSVGQPRDRDPRAAYALWNRSTAQLQMLRVSYDLDRTLSGIRAAELPDQLVQRLCAGA